MRRTNTSRQLYAKLLQTAIGAAARTARKRQGLTQADVAEALGITRDFYSCIERGLAGPSMPTLYSMAIVLETSVDALLGRTEIPPTTAGSTRPREPAGKGGAVARSPELRRLTRQLANASPKTLEVVTMLVTWFDRMAR